MGYTAGVYSAPLSPGAYNTATTGGSATPAAWNALLTDLSTALSTCLLKDGTQTVTANIPMATFKITGLGAGTLTTDAANVGQLQTSQITAAAVSGTADAVVLTLTPAATTAVAGFRVSFTATGTNTGPMTVNSGAGALPLVWPSGVALVAGDVKTGARIIIEIQAAGIRWNLMTVTDPVTLHTVTTKGDILAATASATIARQGVGAGGAVLMANPAATTGVGYFAILTGFISGLIYQNNAGDATNDLDHAAGSCMDATGAYPIVEAALTKRSDANWAVGTGAGALDTGSVGDSDYYIWAIARSDTGVTDILYSLSSTAPTVPANYDFKRLIGWFKRTGGAIVAFKTYETAGGGLQLLWSSPTLDVNLATTLTTARRTDAVKVPLNISTDALLNVVVQEGTTTDAYAWIYCPDQADLAPGNISTAPLATIQASQAAPSSFGVYQQITVKTSAAGLIAARASLATMDQYSVSTLGFTMARR